MNVGLLDSEDCDANNTIHYNSDHFKKTKSSTAALTLGDYVSTSG